MKKRSTECETVFGQTKGNLGFRRFHLRGKEKVGIEWGLLMLGYDFKQLIRLINKHRLVGPEKDNLNNFINIFINSLFFFIINRIVVFKVKNSLTKIIW